MDWSHSEEGAAPPERERLFASILDTVQALVVMFDGSGHVCFLNRAAQESCRRARDGGGALSPRELLGGPDEDANARMERMRAGELASPFESSWVNVEGESCFLEWTYGRELDGRGELESILCTGIDVTERRRTKQALRGQIQFLQNLIDTVPNPLFYKTKDGRYQGCNKAFEAMIGLAREQIVGKTVYDVHPRELGDFYFAQDRELFEHPGVRAYERSVRYATGEVREVVYYKATYRDLSGEVIGLVGTFLDITERKRAEHELARTLDELEARVQARTAELQEQKERAEAADRIKSEFLNIASHELRTPLTTLRLTFHEVERGLAEGRVLDPCHLTRIDRQLSRLTRMVADLLDVARLEKGTLALRPREIDLRALVAETVDDFRPIAGARSLKEALPPSPVWISGDADRLRQVLAQLIDNALMDTHPETPVEVRLAVHGETVRVSVADHGPLIPAEEQTQLFAPALRLPSEHSQEGLRKGLYLSRQIVQGHGGEIGIDSAPGRGNTFSVDLPRARRTAGNPDDPGDPLPDRLLR